MAVLIEGPRGIGKTTSASRVSNDIIRLTEAGDLALAQADPEASTPKPAARF